MFLNNSSLESNPKPRPQNPQSNPNYDQLVRFLIEPFLDSPDTLRVDCEHFASLRKTWIRLAVEAEDKGRVYGRGGRNIQAIRMVLIALAAASGETIYLDIYNDSESDESHREREPRESFSHRSPGRYAGGEGRTRPPTRSSPSKPRLNRRYEE
ncbi:KH domain-containing protein [Planktothrix tepida]|uniref:KH domain-containing protein n=1 Tax=Planktothrix tepida TaxID=1678309 RepID=UPI000933FCA5|nr:KH domain-containing protein [Planktothrix tepida]